MLNKNIENHINDKQEKIIVLLFILPVEREEGTQIYNFQLLEKERNLEIKNIKRKTLIDLLHLNKHK